MIRVHVISSSRCVFGGGDVYPQKDIVLAAGI